MEMMENLAIGERISLARESTGMTQAELGEMIDVSVSTILQYEAADTGMKLDTIRLIAAATRVSTGFLLGFEEMSFGPIMEWTRAERRALNDARNANGSSTATEKALCRAADLIMLQAAIQ